MIMTEIEAKTMLEAYIECDRRKNDVAYEKQCHDDCDNCKLCYEQGTVGEQREAVNMAIKALEKQIPKKPIMKLYFEDIEEEYLCCQTCGDILSDRILFENKDFYFHCLECGQAFDWSENI